MLFTFAVVFLGANFFSFFLAAFFFGAFRLTGPFATFAANDIVGFALDVDNGNVYLYQNGSVLNSGNAVVSGKTGKTWFPFANFDAGDVTGIEHNFGGTQSFAISSGNTDGDGYGNFEYAVPSGYFSLNTKNLAEYG